MISMVGCQPVVFTQMSGNVKDVKTKHFNLCKDFNGRNHRTAAMQEISNSGINNEALSVFLLDLELVKSQPHSYSH